MAPTPPLPTDTPRERNLSETKRSDEERASVRVELGLDGELAEHEPTRDPSRDVQVSGSTTTTSAVELDIESLAKTAGDSATTTEAEWETSDAATASDELGPIDEDDE